MQKKLAVMFALLFLSNLALADEAARILEQAGIKGGLVVHLNCGDGSLTAQLRAGDACLVQGLGADAADVAAARRKLIEAGTHGPVTVRRLPAGRLPYSDNLVNLLVVSEGRKPAEEEILRVLAPLGVAMIEDGADWRRITKPWPDTIDEWTHFLHGPDNNPVAHDTVVGPPRGLQWSAGPNWARHHDHMSSTSVIVTSRGRVFTIMDMGPRAAIMMPSDWRLIARDAFSGVKLWEKPIPEWYSRLWPLKSGVYLATRRLVAVGDKVYVTLGLKAEVSELDAATGKVLRTFTNTAGTEEILVTDDALVLVVHPSPEALDMVRDYKSAPESQWYADEIKQGGQAWNDFLRRGRERKLMAVDRESGQVRWQKVVGIVSGTVSTDGDGVYVHTGGRLVAYGLGDGSERWDVDTANGASGASASPTVIARDGVVYVVSGEHAVHDAKTGTLLWRKPNAYNTHYGPKQGFVIDGLVWAGHKGHGSIKKGHSGFDLKTGEQQRHFKPDVTSFSFHRCYRSKASTRYIFDSSTGIECIDLANEAWDWNNWVRGACVSGFIPANGMLYTPPTPCGCYLESKLVGFNALAPAPGKESEGRRQEAAERLLKGPAFASSSNMQSDTEHSADWPTYRHDPGRSGSTGTRLDGDIARVWETDLNGKLSALTAAGGLLFVSQVDRCVLSAVGMRDGKVRWNYPLPGRVDSPPTLWRGLAIFGCQDGSIFCLQARDGALVWRFRAGPDDEQIVIDDRVASPWPVPGSVLVRDGQVYAVAGRSRFLDGGLRLLRLDAATGELLSETVLGSTDEHGVNLHESLRGQNLPTASTDILLATQEAIYLRSQPFDFSGTRLPLDLGLKAHEQLAREPHLLVAAGFLDDEWFHRTYWMIGSIAKGGNTGWYEAARYGVCGRILVIDGNDVYGYGREPHQYMWRTANSDHLFKAGLAVKPERIAEVQGWIDSNKGDKTGFTPGGGFGKVNFPYIVSRHRKLMDQQPLAKVSAADFAWSKRAPDFHVRALVKAGNCLVAAGPPRLADHEKAYENPQDQAAWKALDDERDAWLGRHGGILTVVDPADGTERQRIELDSPPVWDGMIVADGNIFLSAEDGRLQCFGGRVHDVPGDAR